MSFGRKTEGENRLNSRNMYFGFLCYLIPFILIVGYFSFLALSGKIEAPSGYYMIHYMYTYDHGFVARGLVGEVISWFFDSVNDDVTQGVSVLFSGMLAVSTALCIGKVLSMVKDDKKLFNIVLILSVILCVYPNMLNYYFTDVKLDKAVWAVALFAVFVADRKYAVWLVPGLCILATLINPIFLFCSMILISIIILQEFYSNGFKLKNGIICAVSYIAMIVLGIYGPMSEKWLGFETPKELVEFYFARYTGEKSIDMHEFETEWLYDYFEPLDEIIRRSFKIYFHEWETGSTTILNIIFVAIPVYTLLVMFWTKAMKNEENKFQKFIFFLCMISPIVLIPPIIISWETPKYTANNFVVQIGLIIYYIVKRNPAVMTTLHQIGEFCKTKIIYSALIILYLMIVATRV